MSTTVPQNRRQRRELEQQEKAQLKAKAESVLRDLALQPDRRQDLVVLRALLLCRPDVRTRTSGGPAGYPSSSWGRRITRR